MRTSSIPELLLTLDRAGPIALHRQLERGLQDAIRTGRLQPGAPLPSTRALAAELQVSRGVVVEAYEQLTAEGYLESRPGGKTRVGRRPTGLGDGRGGPATDASKGGATGVATDGRGGLATDRRGGVATDGRGGLATDGRGGVAPEGARYRARNTLVNGQGVGAGEDLIDRRGAGARRRGGQRSRDATMSPDVPPAEVEPPGEDEVVPAFALTRARWDFSYGRPDVTAFPRQTWLRSLRRVLNDAPAESLSYIDGRGSIELREALASYLNRVRATSATASRMVITNGFAQGQRLVLQVVKAMGGRRVGMEDPGQIDTQRAAELHGMELVRVPVDAEGIDVERLAATNVDVVVLTPAHQFPTGAVVSPARRAALVRWARERDSLVLEDDYDAEYRYDREPIGAIQGLAPDRVIYAGSASKTLAPGLRLGWLILPARLIEPFATAKFVADRGSPSLEQLAFADFLARGEFDRHLRRMRPIYRSRRDALLRALSRFLPEVRPVGASAGLHVLAWLPRGIDEAGVLARAAELDIAVDGLSMYRGSGSEGPGALILGYARLTEREIGRGVELLARAIQSR